MSVVRRRSSTTDELVASTSAPTKRQQTTGVILRVKLKNFMCHDHLDVELNECVNFITGPNGSGKSAILTGIMVALGSKARSTDRAASLKALVKGGRPSCLVSITLSNAGVFTYKPDVYGNTITVDRTITASGSGTYVLKSSSGKIVSKSNRELTSVLHALNIQVDNPVTVLTQDTSKNFLRVDDPRRKYQLFLRASCLEQIRHDYDDSNKTIELSNQRLANEKKGLPLMRRKIESRVRQLNMLKNMDKLQDEVELLKRKVLWAKVNEAEAKAVKLQAEHKQVEDVITAVQTQRRNVEERRDECKRCVVEVEERREQANEQLKQKQDHLSRCMADFTTAKSQLSEALAAGSSAASNISALRQDRDNMRHEIERIKNVDYPGLLERRRQLQEQLETAGKQVQQLRDLERARSTQLDHVTSTVQRLQDDSYQAKAQQSQIHRQVAVLETEIEKLRLSSRDANSVFGSWVSDVQRAIDRAVKERAFRVRPVGPLGAHIKMKPGSEKWAPLVETCLSNMLSSYLVDNYDDQEVMTRIIRSVLRGERHQPQIICSKFLSTIHDIKLRGIDTWSGTGHTSVWSVLDVDNVIVANAIIDNNNVESILLLESDKQARYLMSEKVRVPKGCSQAYTLAGYQYFPDPSYRTYPVRVQRQARFLHVSVDEALRHRQEEIVSRRDQLTAAANSSTEIATSLSKHLDDQRQLKQLLAQTNNQLTAACHQLRRLQNEEVPEPLDLHPLEEEVKVMESDLAEAESSAAPLRERESLAQQRCDAARQAVQASRQENQQFVDQTMQPLLNEIDKSRTRVAQLDTSLVRHDQKIAQLRQQLQQQQQELQHAEEAVQRLNNEAEASGDKVNVTVSSIRLERQLSGLQRSLSEGRAEAAASGSSREKLEEQLVAARQQYEQISSDLAARESELRRLCDMMHVRLQRFGKLRLGLSQRMAHYFVVNLEARRYRGRLTFDHEAGLLKMSVAPRQADHCSEKAPQQLSGGERSFSTLSFILALWEVINSPFHMLDEFDVFMDEVNRKIGHDILVNSAQSSPSQFVFISPLTLPSIGNDPNVSVLKLQPPRR